MTPFENSITSPPQNEISAWDYLPSISVSADGDLQARRYTYAPRVLEIGCGHGDWCFQIKDAHPEWVVEGVDDVDTWSATFPSIEIKYVYPSLIHNVFSLADDISH